MISLVAAALSGKQILQYKVKVPINRPLVLYCDTEQSRFHCHRLISRVYKLINYPTTEVHENLKFISLREYPTKESISIIEYALSKYAGKICLVIIDGIRDLVYDINNATEATEITGKLMKWSQELNIHIHTVLHLNKGDDNTRGHLPFLSMMVCPYWMRTLTCQVQYRERDSTIRSFPKRTIGKCYRKCSTAVK